MNSGNYVVNLPVGSVFMTLTNDKVTKYEFLNENETADIEQKEAKFAGRKVTVDWKSDPDDKDQYKQIHRANYLLVRYELFNSTLLSRAVDCLSCVRGVVENFPSEQELENWKSEEVGYSSKKVNIKTDDQYLKDTKVPYSKDPDRAPRPLMYYVADRALEAFAGSLVNKQYQRINPLLESLSEVHNDENDTARSENAGSELEDDCRKVFKQFLNNTILSEIAEGVNEERRGELSKELGDRISGVYSSYYSNIDSRLVSSLINYIRLPEACVKYVADKLGALENCDAAQSTPGQKFDGGNEPSEEFRQASEKSSLQEVIDQSLAQFNEYNQKGPQRFETLKRNIKNLGKFELAYEGLLGDINDDIRHACGLPSLPPDKEIPPEMASEIIDIKDVLGIGDIGRKTVVNWEQTTTVARKIEIKSEIKKIIAKYGWNKPIRYTVLKFTEQGRATASDAPWYR